MWSSPAFQYGQMPGAYPGVAQNEYSYGQQGLPSTNQNDPPYTEDYFMETMNSGTPGYNRSTPVWARRHRRPEEFVDRSGGSFSNSSSRQRQMYSTMQHDELTAVFENFQRQEQVQFKKPRNQNPGSNVTTPSGPNHMLPAYTHQAPLSAHGVDHDHRHRPSGRNNRVSSLRNERTGHGKPFTLPPQAWNQGSSNSVASGRYSDHPTSDSFQHHRPEPIRNQYSAYGSAYGVVNQPSPYLLHGQSSTNYKNSPYARPAQATGTRMLNEQQLHPPHSQSYMNPISSQRASRAQRTGTRVSDQQSPYLLHGQSSMSSKSSPYVSRAQFTGTRTSNLNAVRSSIPSFIQPQSNSPSVIRSQYSAEPKSPKTLATNTRLQETPLGPKVEDYEVKQEPGKKATKRKNNLFAKKCPTVRKIIEKQGQTKVVNGQLMWLDPNEPDNRKWKPAVVMDDIRKYIIGQQDREAEAMGTQYLHPDPPGGEPYGETAFFLPHWDLGKARDNRADLVFVIEDLGQHNGQPDYDPGWMMFDPVTQEIGPDGSLIVLNPIDNPIVNWREMPLCISPHMDGSKMEYMRRVNRAIRHEDIWARMPRSYFQNPNDPRTLRQLSGTNSMVNMPAKRFRERVGVLAWADRCGSDELQLGLKNFLQSSEIGRQCLAANSMKGFGRDLDPTEVLFIKRGNAHGKFLKHAGNRALDDDTRQKLKARVDQRIAKALGQVNPRKRSHDDSEDDLEILDHHVAIPQMPQKRVCRAGKLRDTSVEGDHAMFDGLPPDVGSHDPTQSYGLRRSVTKEVNRQKQARVEDLYGEDSPEEDDEYPDDKDSNDEYHIDDYDDALGAETDIEDSNDTSSPDSIPTSTTGIEEASKVDEVRDQSDDPEEQEKGEGHDAQPDDKHDEPVNITPITTLPTTIAPATIMPPDPTPNPTSDDPPNQPSDAHNAEAKESDLSTHRKRTREFLLEDEEDYATSLKRRKTTQPPSRYPNAINPLHPSAPPPSETTTTTTTTATDYSELAPTTSAEVASIAKALLPTKKIFWEWTGQTVPQPDRQASYGQQFRELHDAFEDWWRGRSSGNAEAEDLPVLVRVTHWGDSIHEWEPVRKDGVYYEAFKKGHRAPRDEDGRIVDVPGPLLEKWGDVAV